MLFHIKFRKIAFKLECFSLFQTNPVIFSGEQIYTQVLFKLHY